ncbi:MAG: hypothetical protein HC804_07415 [Anaerolineae bacterium]|nr:hypothetical protein [Anaerolineae bacterium]
MHEELLHVHKELLHVRKELITVFPNLSFHRDIETHWLNEEPYSRCEKVFDWWYGRWVTEPLLPVSYALNSPFVGLNVHNRKIPMPRRLLLPLLVLLLVGCQNNAPLTPSPTLHPIPTAPAIDNPLPQAVPSVTAVAEGWYAGQVPTPLPHCPEQSPLVL